MHARRRWASYPGPYAQLRHEHVRMFDALAARGLPLVGAPRGGRRHQRPLPGHAHLGAQHLSSVCLSVCHVPSVIHVAQFTARKLVKADMLSDQMLLNMILCWQQSDTMGNRIAVILTDSHCEHEMHSVQGEIHRKD